MTQISPSPCNGLSPLTVADGRAQRGFPSPDPHGSAARTDSDIDASRRAATLARLASSRRLAVLRAFLMTTISYPVFARAQAVLPWK
jgi:hypothetical protein